MLSKQFLGVVFEKQLEFVLLPVKINPFFLSFLLLFYRRLGSPVRMSALCNLSEGPPPIPSLFLRSPAGLLWGRVTGTGQRQPPWSQDQSEPTQNSETAAALTASPSLVLDSPVSS